MNNFVCIHGHFYQPPRENPWLEAVEVQDSAYPYHDWNERILAECYAPNASARMLDDQNRIVSITNNYARINFDFGPTLLSWMEQHSPDLYQLILDADKESQHHFAGHGSAIAQAYNHMILPLANRRDKETQILWGIRDFEHRYRRSPEGMWLPETAVDLETLELLASFGIAFTILSSHQARRVRKLEEVGWKEVPPGELDTRVPYLCRLPSGKDISLFFYNGPISRAVAFDGLLRNGQQFAERLVQEFEEEKSDQLVHIATDGETYGHHHRHGDMALAYALHSIQTGTVAAVTNYGEFLEHHPPAMEVEIVENSSWSCAHGLERWRSDCGCNTGGGEGYRQAWRTPLREALDELRDGVSPLYEERASLYFDDPWKTRDNYISVILDRSDETMSRFLEENAKRVLNERERIEALKLLELARHAMLMYTSCGWFFNDISGIESVQILHYAGRAIQLAEQLFEKSFEISFLARLTEAKSNLPAMGNGRRVYEKFVVPSRADLRKVAAHYGALSTLQEKFSATTIYCYAVDLEDHHLLSAGRSKLAVGRVKITSQITREWEILTFALLHLGDHNIHGGVRNFRNEESYQQMVAEIGAAFQKADFPDVIRVMDRHLGESVYSLKSLFHDEQRKVLHSILENTLKHVEGVYRNLHEQHAPLMRFFIDLRVPLPKAFQTAAEFVLHVDIRRALAEEPIPLERISQLLTQAREEQVPLDSAGLSFSFQGSIERLGAKISEKPEDVELLVQLEGALNLLKILTFEVNLWKIQNQYFALTQSIYPKIQRKAKRGDSNAVDWVQLFRAVGEKLLVKTPE